MSTGELDILLASCECAGPVSSDAIRDIEHDLDVQLPESYKQFLSRFGAANCHGVHIAGIIKEGHEPPYWSALVRATLQIRRASRGKIPHAYIPVSDDGGDCRFYLDTSRLQDGECPVVVLGPGRDGTDVAATFEEFAVRWIRNNLSY